MTFSFDDATRVEAVGDGTYVGHVNDGWDIRGNANGGYVMALMNSAMRDASGRTDPISITLHYLAPLPPCRFEIATEVIKRGRRFTTVSASMIVDGRTAIRAIGAFGELADPAQGLHHVDIPRPDLPPFAQCRARDPHAENIPLALMSKLNMRLHPDDLGFAFGQPSGRSLMRGYFAFADERPIDTHAVLLAADAFAPPVFNLIEVPGWVPTVELTVHLRARPAPGPLSCSFEARAVQGGMFEEDGVIFDENGVLVAQSRQIGLVPL